MNQAEPVNAKKSDTLTEQYFQRIGYTGNASPTLATLKEIHRLHPQAIPFENLNPFLRLPVALDIDALRKKIIDERRGGYCFEQNLLLSHVLKHLGFTVRWLAARVVWNQPEDTITARDHMLMQVTIDGEAYIADVGFGGLTLTAPLLLTAGTTQPTPHENFRLKKENGTYILQAEIKDGWKSLYRFDLQEQFLPDYEVASWYLSNHPDSHFITGLIAARVTPTQRYALRNTELAVHTRQRDTTRRTLRDVHELTSVLEHVMGVNLASLPAPEPALEKLFTKQG